MKYICKSCKQEVTPVGYRDPGGAMYTCTNLGSCRKARISRLTSADVEPKLSAVEQAVVDKVLYVEEIDTLTKERDRYKQALINIVHATRVVEPDDGGNHENAYSLAFEALKDE